MPKKKTRRPAGRRPARIGPSRPLDQLQGQLREMQPSIQHSADGHTTPETEADTGDARTLALTEVAWESVAEREPQALGMTYRFETPADGDALPLNVRFRGRRLGGPAQPGGHDTFDVVRRVPAVPPGTGHMTVTTRVLDIDPGEWRVQVEAHAEDVPRGTAVPTFPRANAVGKTAFAPVVRVRAPGVTLGAWPGCVIGGAVLGLVIQALLARHLQFPALTALLVTLVACLVGVVGGKTYFLALHRDRQAKGLLMVGMAIQGFVLALVATVVVGALITGLPLGAFLDATAVGLLFGMTIGRFGCFFGGCCAGRPTSSRLGLWSSDRDLGVRRIPTQLLESALAASLGTTMLLLLTLGAPTPRGVVFVGSLAAYTLGRQLLFPLRDLPRTTSNGRRIVAGSTAVTCIAAIVVAFQY